MTFIQTVPPESAPADVAAIYAADVQVFGALPNFTQAFSQRPAVYRAWRQLNGAIKAEMDMRLYELATLAAARRLRSSYCTLAHGTLIADELMDEDSVRAIVADHHAAGLDATDVAVMDLAEKIVDDATAVTQADIDGVREHGLSDADILGVVTAAAARCFFSKSLDALGVQPDHKYAALDPELRDALVVGRPIATA